MMGGMNGVNFLCITTAVRSGIDSSLTLRMTVGVKNSSKRLKGCVIMRNNCLQQKQEQHSPSQRYPLKRCSKRLFQMVKQKGGKVGRAEVCEVSTIYRIVILNPLPFLAGHIYKTEIFQRAGGVDFAC